MRKIVSQSPINRVCNEMDDIGGENEIKSVSIPYKSGL